MKTALLTVALISVWNVANAICETDELSTCDAYREAFEKCRKNSGPTWDCSKDFQVSKARLAAEEATYQKECEALYADRRRAINLCVKGRMRNSECLTFGKPAASCDNTEKTQEAIDQALKESKRAELGGAIEKEKMCSSRPSEKGKRECAEATKTMRECILRGDTEKECQVQPNVKYGFELADQADAAKNYDEMQRAQVKAAEERSKLPGVKIGMSQKQVIEKTSWGAPESVNRTTTAAGVGEQWVYGGGNYLYFTNGRLTAIQN